jgi:hypothetical protein
MKKLWKSKLMVLNFILFESLPIPKGRFPRAGRVAQAVECLPKGRFPEVKHSAIFTLLLKLFNLR